MNGEVYLWPSAAEKKLRTAYQTELPAYLYGVTSDRTFSEQETIPVFFGAEHHTGRSGYRKNQCADRGTG